MAVIPTFDDWTPQEEPTAAKLNVNVRDAGNFFLNPPSSIVQRNATNQVMANGDFVTFDTIVADNDNMVDFSFSTTRVSFTTSGLYAITLQWKYTDAGGGTFRTWNIESGGTDLVGWTRGSVTGSTRDGATGIFRFSTNDNIRVRLDRDGGSVTLNTGTPPGFQLTVCRLGA